jgi:hypothetical protein
MTEGAIYVFAAYAAIMFLIGYLAGRISKG